MKNVQLCVFLLAILLGDFFVSHCRIINIQQEGQFCNVLFGSPKGLLQTRKFLLHKKATLASSSGSLVCDETYHFGT